MRLYYKPKVGGPGEANGLGPLVVQMGGTRVWQPPGEVWKAERKVVRQFKDKDTGRPVKLMYDRDGRLMGGPGTRKVWEKTEEVGRPVSYLDVEDSYGRMLLRRSVYNQVLFTEKQWMEMQGMDDLDREIAWLESKRKEKVEVMRNADLETLKRGDLMRIAKQLGWEGVATVKNAELIKFIQESNA